MYCRLVPPFIALTDLFSDEMKHRTKAASVLLLVTCVVGCGSIVTAMASRAVPSSPDACLSLGFDTNVLRCSTCRRLKRSLPNGPSELIAECQQCCDQMPQADTTAGAGDQDDDSDRRYDTAVLELDESWWGEEGSPFHVAVGMLKADNVYASRSKVEIRHKWRSWPKLLMSHSMSGDRETVDLRQWTKDQVVEYLRDKLVSEGS